MIEHYDFRRSLDVPLPVSGHDVLKVIDKGRLESIAQQFNQGKFSAVGVHVSKFSFCWQGVLRAEAEVFFEHEHLRIHLVTAPDLSQKRLKLESLYGGPHGPEYLALGLSVYARSEPGVYPQFNYGGVYGALICIKLGMDALLKELSMRAGDSESSEPVLNE